LIFGIRSPLDEPGQLHTLQHLGDGGRLAAQPGGQIGLGASFLLPQEVQQRRLPTVQPGRLHQGVQPREMLARHLNEQVVDGFRTDLFFHSAIPFT
jgi:hypothetical protein